MKTVTRPFARAVLPLALTLALAPPAAVAAESYSPYAKRTYPMDVFWGDTHLHSNLSLDANGMGNKALSPDEAYRFAKGEAVIAHNGMRVRLRRPLDFLVVADHAENIGVMPRLEAGDPLLLKTETGKLWHERMREYPLETRKVLTAHSEGPYVEASESVFNQGPMSFFWAGFRKEGTQNSHVPQGYVGYIGDKAFRRSAWMEVTANAERHNKPGTFTAFSGYEWTSGGKKDGNLHRIVIFKDGPDKTNQVLPFSAIDSLNPEDLWAYMASYQQKTGGEILAIPHNGNTSNGEMFAVEDWSGQPLSRDYAQTRSRWEPLVEVTQIKGDSETHPILSPTDEFADYETWNSWEGPTYEGVKTKGWEKRKEAEYARSALKLGLDQQAKLGINPFKFGMIGSTDAHTSLAAVAENNFWGKMSLAEPSPYRSDKDIEGNWAYYTAASGYAAVWATENTREALFAAMKRKETYATTGPRMNVRFFGGWAYEQSDAQRPDLVKTGYSKGVPMGGDLAEGPEGKAPSFLISVVKDPDGANLDRVQVIKGWRGSQGELYEKVYNVALSDGRKVKNGQVPPVGNTVDVGNASYTNTIGDPELAVVWADPDFNPNEIAFYYVRVLEIPTPRWPAYDAKFFGLKDIPAEVATVTQERAYTSPIWYTP